MQLDLTRYRQPLASFSRTFKPEEVADEADPYRVVVPVSLQFEIHKDKDKFRLVGQVQTRLELACSRCLEPFELPVDAPFDLRYLPPSEVSGDGDREVAENDLETTYYR